MLNDLLLIAGTDIPFPQAQISIHQPTIREISFIGEESFFSGCEFLNFSKDILNEQDKVNLENRTNFEIFMSIMRDRNLQSQKSRISVVMILTLIFPDYQIKFLKDSISLIKDGKDEHFISEKNFEAFKEIIVSMFCLKERNKEQEYNVKGKTAKAIAEKLKKGREKAAAAQDEKPKISLLSRYISILAVGQKRSIISFLDYTVYQLFDEYNRFELKQAFDMNYQARLAGAQNLDDAENWMKEIHS